jgi:hypothetical protein
MSNIRREVGFLRAVARLRVGALLWPEGVIALAVGVGGGVALCVWGTRIGRTGVVGEGLAITGLLLGVTFTAFAFLISFMSEDYIELLNEAEDGVLSFTRPFILAIGLQIFTLIVGIFYKAAQTHLPSGVEKVTFVVWCVVAAYVLVDVLALGRNMAMHGLARARQVLGKTQDAAGIARIERFDRKFK